MNKIMKLMASVLLAFTFLAAPFAARADDVGIGKAIGDLRLRVDALASAGAPATTLEAMAAELAALRACACETRKGVDEAQAAVDRMEGRFVRLLAADKETLRQLAAVRTVLEDYGRQIDALKAKDREHDGTLADHAERLDALRGAQVATAGDVADLQEAVSDLKVRMTASEERERMFDIQLLAGGAAGYAADMGGESRTKGIFLAQPDGTESRYKTSRFGLHPYVGAAVTYRERFYTDLTIGFTGETGNQGIGLRLQMHLGGNIGTQKRWTAGLTSFYEVVKSGGDEGGTYSVIDTRLGGGAFLKYAIWRSKQGAVSVDVGVHFQGERATAAVLTDQLGFGALRADGFAHLRVGKSKPALRVEVEE